MNDFLIFTLKEKHVSEPKLTNIVGYMYLCCELLDAAPNK